MYIYRFARISHVTDCAVYRVRIRITRMLKIGDGMINREAVVAAAIIFHISRFFFFFIFATFDELFIDRSSKILEKFSLENFESWKIRNFFFLFFLARWINGTRISHFTGNLRSSKSPVIQKAWTSFDNAWIPFFCSREL